MGQIHVTRNCGRARGHAQEHESVSQRIAGCDLYMVHVGLQRAVRWAWARLQPAMVAHHVGMATARLMQVCSA